jgi:hypothetical protein
MAMQEKTIKYFAKVRSKFAKDYSDNKLSASQLIKTLDILDGKEHQIRELLGSVNSMVFPPKVVATKKKK